jgi:hypothetical protein
MRSILERVTGGERANVTLANGTEGQLFLRDDGAYCIAVVSGWGAGVTEPLSTDPEYVRRYLVGAVEGWKVGPEGFCLRLGRE